MTVRRRSGWCLQLGLELRLLYVYLSLCVVVTVGVHVDDVVAVVGRRVEWTLLQLMWRRGCGQVGRVVVGQVGTATSEIGIVVQGAWQRRLAQHATPQMPLAAANGRGTAAAVVNDVCLARWRRRLVQLLLQWLMQLVLMQRILMKCGIAARRLRLDEMLLLRI